jgi:hypothetical protein
MMMLNFSIKDIMKQLVNLAKIIWKFALPGRRNGEATFHDGENWSSK